MTISETDSGTVQLDAPAATPRRHGTPATLERYPVATMVDVLRLQAAERPDQIAFIHLVDGEDDVREITYGDLYRQALAVAHHLSARHPAGKRVLMLFEAGIDYVAALFGVLMAGAVAVPSFPPVGTRALGRLASIAQDAQSDIILTNGRFSKLRDRVLAMLPDTLPEDAWTDVDPLLLGDKNAYTYKLSEAADALPQLDPQGLALLQYTSGSTSAPKGVMLTHGNLLSNCHCASRWMGGARARVGCTWLPPYHDMGLMGGILQPIYEGFPTVILSPGHFVQRPYRWLAAVSRYRVTTTIAPNFAFDLCCDTISDAELATLDLSTVEAIYCGAEPVRLRTFERFAARFAPRGFRAAAFGPCYGLAEATVFVTGKPDGAAPIFTSVDQERLAHGAALDVPGDHPRAQTLAGCGIVAPGHDLRIVDPANGRALPDGAIGEIWVSGPNIGVGYWNQPERSLDTFHATLPGSPARYLRTGDLGFLRDGELFVTGRIKDLIIHAGRNLYPQDIEQLVQETDARIRPNGVAAFSIDTGASEQIAVVAELRRGERVTSDDLHSLRAAIVERVTLHLGAAPHVIHFAPTGAIPLTTSGKIQRYATRQALLAESLASYPHARS
jgi:acyl-CoA synthetase (AMP-forming)/AMP-acid ligase II